MELFDLTVGGVHVIDICDDLEVAYDNARDYAGRHGCNVSIVSRAPRYMLDTISPA